MASDPKRKFQTLPVLSDSPLRHGDEAHFHFDEFAITLARLIADKTTRTPLTIGVSGPWGSGKTTLLKRVQKILDEPIDPKTKKHRFANDAVEQKRFRPCKTVWFDAWKYNDEDELLVALVRRVLSTMDAGNLRDKFWKEWIDPTQPGYDVIAMFLNAFKLNFGGIEVQLQPDNYKVDTEFKTHTAFFDYFDQAFEMLLARWVHGKGDYRQIDEKQGALVVFIDDLDRCLPAKTVQVLEAVKLFLDKPGCIFVLGADVDLIQQAVASHYKDITGQKADDYLEKVIQLRFRLPPIVTDAMQAYLQSEANRGEVGYNQAVDDAMLARWQALVAAAEANPRRVKTVINDLNLQWYMLQNSGQAQGVNRDDFICWQALMRAAPTGFRETFFNISEDEPGLRLRHDLILDALKWMCGAKEEMKSVEGRFRDYTGSDARRLRDVLQQIRRFSDDFTPVTLHAHVHLIAPPPPQVEEAQLTAQAVPLAREGELIGAVEALEERPALKGAPARPGEPLAGEQTWGKQPFVPVPKGAFVMGSQDDNKLAYDDEKPQHNLDIPYDYWIARFPLTNARFEEFVQSKPYRTTAEEVGSGYAYAGKEWKDTKGADWRHPRGPKSSLQGKADHPVVQVSWLDAMACCRWLNEQYGNQLPEGYGYRLPTEAEWEKAARGPYGNEWPWGKDFDSRKCNSEEGKQGDTTPVGAYSTQGDSPYGAADMVGNVWEWTHSRFEKYPYQAGDGREVEDESGQRVLRGGSFSSDRRFARCAFRRRSGPSYRNEDFGFRVVVSPILKSGL